jgi:hypothetical protein
MAYIPLCDLLNVKYPVECITGVYFFSSPLSLSFLLSFSIFNYKFLADFLANTCISLMKFIAAFLFMSKGKSIKDQKKKNKKKKKNSQRKRNKLDDSFLERERETN